MQEITDWLSRIGLPQYAQRFSENDIDFRILSELTDQDLEKLGVISIGHRHKLLRAIGEIRDLDKRASPVITAAASSGSRGVVSAERRQVTVLFADLVGSTAMASRMDPEDLREVISSYQKTAVDTVDRFGGFVARYMGDGLLVYFGYPEANEDDAERAVRAGLDLIQGVTAAKSVITLQARVGIATGLVVVGDLIGSGQAQERAIIGQTPNLAGRLQALAEPNTVVIADDTRKLLGELFELEELEGINLKGIAGPMRAWSVLRGGLAESRFEALHASGVTPLVGREEELELLLRRWSKATSGEGQVVLLSGEPGVGKSRLTAALLERLAPEAHARLRYFCSPQHTDSMFYPIIGQMERAAGLAHDDSRQVRLDKLEAVLAQSSTSMRDAALFAEMLSLANDGRYPALELAPPQRRQRTLEALVSRIVALTRSSPALMVFEDVHWIDPTSMEVLGRMVDRLASLRVLLIVTFRPEFAPPWVGRAYVTALTINRLAQREIDAMIDHVVGKRFLPESLRKDIVGRTDGVPLFVEEMTKAVLEAESEGEAQRAAGAVPAPVPAVPASLHASLMARLDRLGPAKQVAQIGAVIGREFSYALLDAVARWEVAELNAALDGLTEAGLLFRQGFATNAIYLFKHALIQDAAYGTLLRGPRRALHARIVETLEYQFTEIAENQPELLAHHCTEAELIEKASGYWAKAGQRSLARSALVEATNQLTRALDQIATLPTTPALRREAMKLQVALITPLMHVKGYASPETKVALERARLLIEEAETLGEPSDDLLLLSVLYGSCVVNLLAFNGDVLRHLAAQFLTLAEKQGTTVPLMLGHRLMATSLLYTGDIAQGRMHNDLGLALYDRIEHRPLATRFGQDARVAMLSSQQLALWLLGYPDAARANSEQALNDAREIGQAATLMFALLHGSLTNILCRNYAEANAETDELASISAERGALFWKAFGMSAQGCLFALTGKAADAVPMINFGFASFQSTGATLFDPLFLSALAHAHAELGQFDDARRRTDEALMKMETTKEKWCEAEVNRVAGEFALLSPEPDEARAEAYFGRALAVARAQHAKSWELRAAMSMARLWRDQGKRHEAHDLLAPVHGWFTEGFDTLDLKEAKALLDELRG